MITNASSENKSATKFEETGMASVHGVNVFHSGDGILHVNTIMIGTIEVKMDEVQKFNELDPREPVAEEHEVPVEGIWLSKLKLTSFSKLCLLRRPITPTR